MCLLRNKVLTKELGDVNASMKGRAVSVTSEFASVPLLLRFLVNVLPVLPLTLLLANGTAMVH
jgi:hypothetical protein